MKTIALLSLATVVATSARAWALDEAAARRHFERATAAFEHKAWDEAAHEYLQCYQVTSDPTLLYNVAQSYKMGGHASQALQYFRMYLTNVPDASDRKSVEALILKLKQQIDREAAPPPPPPPPATVTPPPPPVERELAPAPQPPPPAPSHPGRAMVIAGSVVLAAGAVLALGGVGAGVMAQQLGDQVTSESKALQPFDPSKQSAGQTDQTIEGVLIGIGAAAVVTGVVVLALGVREKARANRAAFDGRSLAVRW
jgi:hypothetical protein